MPARLARAATWAAFAGGGIALGLAGGAVFADVPVDTSMLVQVGLGAAALAAVAGAALPLPSVPGTTHPAPGEPAADATTIDLTGSPAVDLRERPAPRRRTRPAR